jgi:serine protease inhibitor
MAMVKVGARGTTSTEIAKAMGYPETNQELKTGYQKVLESLEVMNV